MSLWVPPQVNRGLREQTADYNAQVSMAAWRDSAYAQHWNPILKGYDPYLELVKAPEVVSEPGFIPGYWHIMRHVPGAPVCLIPLTGDEGEYIEPTSRILDILNAGDLQNERVMRERRAFDERAAAARKRDAQRAHEDRVEQMTDQYLSASRVSIAVPGGSK